MFKRLYSIIRRFIIGPDDAVGALPGVCGNGVPARAKRARFCEEGDDARGDNDGFARLPEECLSQILLYLHPRDLWPAAAFISKSISRNPAVVPVILSACPASRRSKAILMLVETTDCPLACSMVQELELPQLYLGDEGASRLSGALQRGAFPNVRSIGLKNNSIGPTSIEALSGGFTAAQQPCSPSRSELPSVIVRTCPALAQLDLSMNPFGDTGVNSLCTYALESGACRSLQTLQLSGCGIRVRGAEALARALESGHLAALKCLDLEGNYLEGGVLALAQPLRDGRCPAIRELNMRDTSMGPAGAAALAEAVKEGPLASLTLLDLEGNQVGEQGVSALVQAWAHRAASEKARGPPATTHSPYYRASSVSSSFLSSALAGLPLEVLRLANNNLGDAGGVHFSHLLQMLPSLTTLDIALNRLTHEAMGHLFGSVPDERDATTHPLRLTDLDVSGNRIKAEGMEALARCSLQGSLACLTRLNANNCFIQHNGGVALGAALSSNLPAIKVLSLGSNHLGRAGVGALAAALTMGGARNLERLGLNDNCIQDEAAIALSSAISHGACPNLVSLELFANNIQSEGFRRLAVAFRSRCQSLKVLDMGRPSVGPLNAIQSLGIYFLAAVLSEGAFPALTHLHLGGGGIGRSGIYMLQVAFRHHACENLESLDLTSNQGIGDVGATYLASAFRRGGCPKLKILKLGSASLGDVGANRLVHAFVCRPRTMRLLAVLNLANNGITADGLSSLTPKITAGAFPELERLDLSNNKAGARGLACLSKALTSLPSLTSLSLRDNNVGDEGVASLAASMLKAMGRGRPVGLRCLALGKNDVTGFGVLELCNALCAGACPYLEDLDLQKNAISNYGLLQLTRVLQSRHCVSLTDLDLSNNKVDHDGIKVLIGVLSNGDAGAALQRLLLHGNSNVNDDGRRAIAVFLASTEAHNRCPLLTCTY